MSDIFKFNRFTLIVIQNNGSMWNVVLCFQYFYSLFQKHSTKSSFIQQTYFFLPFCHVPEK